MNPNSPGPLVAPVEDLYRGITTGDWWVEEENRPSSAAFKQPDFSTDIVSLAGSVDHTLSHLPEGSGVVQFNCGQASSLGYEIRQELDPQQPENHAHANVYNRSGPSGRKKMAQRLVQLCKIAREPDLTTLARNASSD